MEKLPEKPISLTKERALSFCPHYKFDGNVKDFCGCLKAIPSEIKPTVEEAEYILKLENIGSCRWLASEITGDSNQIIGMELIEVAKNTLTNC